MAGRPRFVLGINSQLVEIDSNRRLSQIVKNLASTNIVVIIIEVMVRMDMELLHLLWLLLYAIKMIYYMFGTVYHGYCKSCFYSAVDDE